jgi:hypothetical protein
MDQRDCEHRDIDWHDAPDYEGCHGMCLRWFGTCNNCGIGLCELWEPKGLRDLDGKEI